MRVCDLEQALASPPGGARCRLSRRSPGGDPRGEQGGPPPSLGNGSHPGVPGGRLSGRPTRGRQLAHTPWHPTRPLGPGPAPGHLSPRAAAAAQRPAPQLRAPWGRRTMPSRGLPGWWGHSPLGPPHKADLVFLRHRSSPAPARSRSPLHLGKVAGQPPCPHTQPAAPAQRSLRSESRRRCTRQEHGGNFLVPARDLGRPRLLRSGRSLPFRKGGSRPGAGPRGGPCAPPAGGSQRPRSRRPRPRPDRSPVTAPAPPAISGALAALRPAGRRKPPAPAPPRPAPVPARLPPAPRSPATGDGLRSTSHLLFHCGDRGAVSSHPHPAPSPRPPRAPTFLPSRSLTWPSTSAASVIFCHGSRAPAAPLPAAPRPPQPRVTFKIAPGGPWAGPARAGRGRGVPRGGCASRRAPAAAARAAGVPDRPSVRPPVHGAPPAPAPAPPARLLLLFQTHSKQPDRKVCSRVHLSSFHVCLQPTRPHPLAPAPHPRPPRAVTRHPNNRPTLGRLCSQPSLHPPPPASPLPGQGDGGGYGLPSAAGAPPPPCGLPLAGTRTHSPHTQHPGAPRLATPSPAGHCPPGAGPRTLGSNGPKELCALRPTGQPLRGGVQAGALGVWTSPPPAAAAQTSWLSRSPGGLGTSQGHPWSAHQPQL